MTVPPGQPADCARTGLHTKFVVPNLDDIDAPTARARRRVLRHAVAVLRWWDTLSDSEHARPFFLASELVRAMNLHGSQLGPALRALGWQYALRRIPERMNTPAAVWAPPGAPNPRRPVGKPRKLSATLEKP